MSTLDGSGVGWLEVIDFRHGRSSATLRKFQVILVTTPRGDQFVLLKTAWNYVDEAYTKVFCIWAARTAGKWVLPEIAKTFPVLCATPRFTSVYTPFRFHCFNNICPYGCRPSSWSLAFRFSKQNFDYIYQCEGLESFRKVCKTTS